MKLEHQVTSLELSQKLEELGVPQESLFWWVDEGRYAPSWRVSFKKKARVHWNSRKEDRFISAFTVAELFEMMPPGQTGNPTVRKNKRDYSVYVLWNGIGGTRAQTPADALAKMLIYLIENKLIEIPEGGEHE